MDWLFRDPLRGLSVDKFPYEIGEDEIELDFMFKSMVYLFVLLLGSVFLLEGGIGVYLGWIGINFLRRKS